MTTTHTPTHKRKNGIFDAMVKSINSFGIGTIYKVPEMRNKMYTGKSNTERVGYYHIHLMTTGCIKRVKRGVYQVIGFIPEFLTMNMCEANGGYDKRVPNPEFIGFHLGGKSIEGHSQTISVPRGKKWKLGEPNPHIICTCKEGEVYNNLCCPEHGNIERRPKETQPNPNLVEIINTLSNMFDSKESDRVIKAHLLNSHFDCIVIVLNIQTTGTQAQVKLPNGTLTIVSLFSLGEFYFSLSEESEAKVLANYSKKNQIIEILKRGLSANDAAELIIHL